MKCGRLLPLLLSLLLSVSLLAPAALARETEFFPDFPEPVPASAQDWSPADPSSFDAARQALLTAVRGEDASERSVLSLLSRMTDRFNELLTEYYFCSLDYMRSPASCTQEYVRYSSVCGQAESDYLSAVQEVLNSAYGSVLAGLLGEGQAQSLLSTSPNTREELALLERETALVNEYWEAVVQEPSVQSGGRTWTRAQADAAYLVGSLEEDAYLTLVGELAAVRNGVLAPIYLELVKVRNQYAASKGYDDYVQYAYQTVYGRDYTPEEAALLHRAVKALLPRLESELLIAQSRLSSLSPVRLSSLEDMTQEEVLDAVEPYMDAVSSEYRELYGYMRDNGLYDLDILASSSTLGVTVSLPAYLFAGLPVHYTYGTNKFSAACGTTFATAQFFQKGAMNIRVGLLAAVGSFVGSALGSHIVLLLSDQVLRTMMLIILPVAAVLILWRRDLPDENRDDGTLNAKKAVLALAIGLGIGLYDGIFGPGTGTFAIIAFTTLMGFDLRTAGGNAKVLNLASNYASLVTYLSSGLVVFSIGIPCAVSGIVGNLLGSHFALKNGAKFIRPMMLVVLVLLLGKIVSDAVL